MERTGRIAGLLLAAGAGRRFGSQKLVEPIQGVPLVRRAAEGLLAATLDEVVVVVGSEAGRVRAALAGLAVRIAESPEWQRGMSASIGAGVASLHDDHDAVVIALGDQPAVGPEIVNPLVDRWRAGGRTIVAPSYRGVVRPPVLFGRAHFPELLALQGDRGARELLEGGGRDLALVQLDRPVPADVDQREDVGEG